MANHLPIMEIPLRRISMVVVVVVSRVVFGLGAPSRCKLPWWAHRRLGVLLCRSMRGPMTNPPKLPRPDVEVNWSLR